MKQSHFFKKGIDAYEKQQLEVAISEFSKVPLHGQDYSEAQHYLNQINYEMLYDHLLIASKTEDLSNKDAEEIKFNYDIVLITKLVNIAEKMGDSKKVLESIDIVISGIKHSSSRSQTEDFLTLLEKIVSRNKEKRIFEKALNFLLTDFGKLYQQAELKVSHLTNSYVLILCFFLILNKQLVKFQPLSYIEFHPILLK